MYDPDLRGPTSLTIAVTPKWDITKGKAKTKCKTTKPSKSSRTKAANLMRKVPTPEQLKLRARLGIW